MKPGTLVGTVSMALVVLIEGPSISARQEPPGQAVARAAQARPAAVRPTVSMGRHDVSVPLRSIAPRPSGLKTKRGGPLPMRPAGKGAPQTQDAALQIAAPAAAAPATIINFEGVSNVDGVLPPDTNGDIGPNHYVQWVNKTLAIYSRNGDLLYGPASGNTIWAGFGGPCETQNDGDPIVLYDHLADRWLLTQFALPNNIAGLILLAPFYQCIAVSQTSDPTGAYYRYEYQFQKLNDYPKFGVWPDGYYMAINQFTPITLSFAGQGVAAFDRAAMLAGQPARMIYYDLASVNLNLGGMLPSDLDGPPPPAGSPAYFVQRDDDADGYPQDQLQLWRFHANWSDPAASSFVGPLTMPVAPFDGNMCGGARNCIPQPGTTAKLDALSDRLMYRLQYRNFGTHESLVVNHTVDVDGTDHAGVRWYEIRDPNGTPVVHQQGTFAPDSLHRWMGSAAMDAAGNLALVYNTGGPGLAPSIRYAGRLASDPAGVLGQGENDLITGTGAQTHTASRWGDYSMLGVDPIDGCTFWATSEYMATTSLAGWQTRIGAFRLPGCGNSEPPPAAPAGLSATTASASRIDLTWNDLSTTETGFSIERCTGTVAACSASGLFIPARHVPADTTAYADSGLLPSTTYTYRARAYNYGGHSEYSNLASATTGEAPAVTVAAAVATANEAGPVNGVFRLTRTGPVTEALSVSYTLGGTATKGTDYQAAASPAVIPAGSAFVDVAIVPINDPTIEPDEIVTLTITAAPGYVAVSPASASITIASDDRSVDLHVSALTIPVQAAPGASIQVSDVTSNGGPDPTPASVTSFYLSTDFSLSANDTLLGTRTIVQISGQGTSAGNTSVVLPESLTAGTYGFFAKADGPGEIAETNEFNNTRLAILRVGPDLAVSALTAPAAAGANVPFTVSDTTTNIGAGTAAASVTHIYLSTDFQLDASDVKLQGRNVPSLATSATSTGTTIVTIPATVPAGSYYLVAKADDGGTVGEQNETNNTRFTAIRVGGDLIVSALTAPLRAAAQSTLVVSDSTANSGANPVPASTTAFYLSTNFNLDPGDTRLPQTRSVPPLAVGATSTGSTSLVLPALAPGSWYLLATADDGDAIVESNETNNTRFATIMVGPDLAFLTINAPLSAGAGTVISLTDTLRNIGAENAGPSTVRFYLSLNTALDTTDILLDGFRNAGALTPNGSNSGMTSVTLPQGIAGAYYLIALADSANAVAEAVETNNTAARPITIGK